MVTIWIQLRNQKMKSCRDELTKINENQAISKIAKDLDQNWHASRGIIESMNFPFLPLLADLSLHSHRIPHFLQKRAKRILLDRREHSVRSFATNANFCFRNVGCQDFRDCMHGKIVLCILLWVLFAFLGDIKDFWAFPVQTGIVKISRAHAQSHLFHPKRA